MVRNILLLILLFVAIGVYAQDNEHVMFVTAISEKPTFEGDLEAYILSHIHYPGSAVADSVEGRVSITFVIDTLGRTYDHKVIRGIRDDLDQEALRVARLIKFDTPAMLKNKAIQVKFMVPVNFYLKYKDGIIKDDGGKYYCKWDYTSAPSLRKVSKKQVRSLCKRLSKEYGGQDKYFPISILVDESGTPSCVKISNAVDLNDQLESYITSTVMSLEFNSAKCDDKNAIGTYLFFLRYDNRKQRWFYPDEFYF